MTVFDLKFQNAGGRNSFHNNTNPAAQQLQLFVDICFPGARLRGIRRWHTWHWLVYGSAHFLSDATLCSNAPASGSAHWGSASGLVYKDGSWNKPKHQMKKYVLEEWQRWRIGEVSLLFRKEKSAVSWTLSVYVRYFPTDLTDRDTATETAVIRNLDKTLPQ